MSNKKKWYIVVSSILLIWLIMLTTDMILSERGIRPVFCIETARYDDGGSIRYTGFFYQVYDIKTINESPPPDIKHEGLYLVPWFFSIDFVRDNLIE
ncbi:hypothetical protein [Peloplasma aerotolerans]|jgi:hypothetical protein|uniref:DUF3688 domain-containing protein n=1 Tax=Peloplasma aerotolerans TaxID=3044389 RepID=A0AAW6U6Z0_9MOLU|nr:hypothetical protein [Mariniplasma sp. M4Ah]MDI6453600.1 hypothetical protein [Mariniplasma sp. M4Ah]